MLYLRAQEELGELLVVCTIQKWYCGVIRTVFRSIESILELLNRFFDQKLDYAPTYTPSHLGKMSPKSTPRFKNKWIDLEDGQTNGLLVSFAVGMTIGSDRKKLSGPVGPSGSILFFARCIYVTLFSRSIGHIYLEPVSSQPCIRKIMDSPGSSPLHQHASHFPANATLTVSFLTLVR